MLKSVELDMVSISRVSGASHAGKLYFVTVWKLYSGGTERDTRTRTHACTHSHLTALCPGLPGWAGTRNVKPMWILLKQETVSGSGISWTLCKSAPRSRQITTPAPHQSVFTSRMPFLPPDQQRQSTEGSRCRDGACNTIKENSSSLALIWMC